VSIDTEPRSASPGRETDRPSTPTAMPPPPVPEPPRLPGRRNPKWIALGIVALCLGGLLSYVIYARVAAETSVVAVAHTVYRGEAIERDDLTTISMRSGTLPQAVPGSQLSNLVGRHAVFDLPEGSVVSSAALADTAVPDVGRAVVGLKLSAGRTPTSLLLPSARVRLVALPAADAASTADKLSGRIYSARIVDQSTGADGTSILVNVDVPADQAPTIALLAATDRIAVVRDAGQ
jgi:SAF domain